MSDSKNSFWKYEYFYLFIAIVSLVLIIWQHYGMNRYLEIYPNEVRSVSVFGDEINGGRSVSTLIEKEDGARLHCQIKLSGTFSFCSLNISIGKSVRHGISLDKYDQLNIWVNQESATRDTLLIYLENSEIDPFNIAKINTKSNLYTLLPSATSTFYEIPLHRFYVPSWWILQNKATAEKADSALNNVTSLRVATGDNTQARNVTIHLKRAQLSGKWISAQTLYLALLINWIVVIAINAITRLYQLNTELSSRRHKTDRLAELNKLLHIEKSQLETLAKTDPLTGIANRVGMRDILQALQRQPGKVCSLIMFDIDHFKKINDTYGHTEGDTVLQSLADLIATETRATDYCARWGGEEFIIICPHTYSGIAYSVADDLRYKISHAGLCVYGQITCSFGVAECQINGEESIKHLFDAADIAMYQAKELGRDRVALSLHK